MFEPKVDRNAKTMERFMPAPIRKHRADDRLAHMNPEPGRASNPFKQLKDTGELSGEILQEKDKVIRKGPKREWVTWQRS